MSFASDLKKDIVNYDFDDNALKAELYGILKLKSELTISSNQFNISIRTTSLNLSRRIIYIIKRDLVFYCITHTVSSCQFSYPSLAIVI